MSQHNIPASSDSLLFFALARKVNEALKLYRDLDEGQFPGESEALEEIQQVVDVPMLDSILKSELEEVDLSLKLAQTLAEKHGLTELSDRIQAIFREAN